MTTITSSVMICKYLQKYIAYGLRNSSDTHPNIHIIVPTYNTLCHSSVLTAVHKYLSDT